MYLSESLQTKWQGVLDHPDLPAIKDPYRKAVTAVILENQAQEMQKSAGMLYEASPANSTTFALVNTVSPMTGLFQFCLRNSRSKRADSSSLV